MFNEIAWRNGSAFLPGEIVTSGLQLRLPHAWPLPSLPSIEPTMINVWRWRRLTSSSRCLLPVPAIGESIDEAASAVSALTRKTKEDALNVKFPALTLRPSDPLECLAPAVASMQHLGQDAAFSVALITQFCSGLAPLICLGVKRSLKPQPSREMN